MTPEERLARLEELRSEITDLADQDGDLEGDDAERWENLNDEFDELRSAQEEWERRETRREEIARATEAFKRPENREHGDGATVERINTRVTPDDDPFDMSEVRMYADSPREQRHELRERAMRAIDSDDQLDADAKTEIERKLRVVPKTANHILATASPDYLRAFDKIVHFDEYDLTGPEREAVRRAKNYARAMSLTDASGGFLVPTHLDPTVIVTNTGSQNPFRQISRVVTVTGDNWNGVASAGVTASWDTEAAEVSDDAPAFQQPSLTPYKGQAFAPISFEAYEDIANIASEVSAMLVDAKDRLEEAAFATGSGSNQPTGIVTELADGDFEIFMSTNSSVAVADVYACQNNLAARFRQNASWVMNTTVLNLIRQLGSDSYNTQTVRLDAPTIPALLGRPVYESTTVSGTVGTGTNNNIVFGDFSNYVIADRLGLSVELIPNLFATGNNRPSGQRGWLAHWRVDGESVNDTAFILSTNPNTAYT